MDDPRMRIHTVLVLLVFAMLSILRAASVDAISPDKRTWSFRFEDTPLLDALEQIHSVSGTELLFPADKSAPENVRRIYIEYTLEEILKDIFSNRNRALIWRYDNGAPKSVEVWLFDQNGDDNWILPDSIPAKEMTEDILPGRPGRAALPEPSIAGPKSGEPPRMSPERRPAREGMWSFTFVDITLEDALKEIYSASGLEVIYPNKEIENREIRKEYLDLPIEQIVKDIFGNDNCAMVWQYEGERPRIVNVWAFEEKARTKNGNGDKSARGDDGRPNGNGRNTPPGARSSEG